MPRAPLILTPGILLTFSLLALVLPNARLAASETEPPTVDLTGTWLRSESESDAVEEKAEAARAADPRAQPGVVFGRSGANRASQGRGRYGGPGRPGSGPTDQDLAPDPFERLARGVEVLRIEHSEPQITVTNANRETRVVFTDGRTLGDGLGSETLARWSGGAVLIESKSETDKRIDTFRLESPERLVVSTEIQHAPANRGRTAAARGGYPGSGPRGTGSRGTGSPGSGFPGRGNPGGPGTGTQPAPGQGPGALPPISFQFRTVYERVDSGERSPTASSDQTVQEAPRVTAQETSRPADPTESGANDAAPFTDPVDLPLPPVADSGREQDRALDDDEVTEDRKADDEADDQTDDPADDWYRPSAATIRILPPSLRPGELLRDKVEIQTLTISPAVEIVEFLLDGESVARKNLPPYDAKISLADPPREQTLEVVALDGRGNRLGEDRLVLNRLDPPFRVRIQRLESTAASGLRVEAEVSVPRKAQLDAVEVYRNEDLVETYSGPAASPRVAADLTVRNVTPRDYIRVVARLRDGRELEDVQLIEGFEFGESIEVHLVQLQVLVTDKYGTPLTGLTSDDLEVIDGGEKRKIDRLYPSRDVALNLGLAIDSSGSMRSIWQQTRSAAESFLDQALSERDRAFLVDFDSQLRLLQSLTGDKRDLFRALGLLEPNGNTALYDSILFSLLQFTAEPGRRALIVFTDGFDSGSKADPKRAIEFGQQLGVPVYIIALAQRGGIAPSRGGLGTSNPAMMEAVARSNLKLITGPTGGRLFQVLNFEQVVDAFEQINTELRSQYVLTYYSDRPPGAGAPPKVKALAKGARVRTALPLDLAD